MKTTLPILLSGAFFAVVQTQNDRITDTGRQLCPVNEIPVTCEPCENFCNEELKSCIDICIGGSFCTCANSYSRISANNRICIPDEWCYLFAKDDCPTTTTTTDTTTTEPPEESY